MSEPNNNKREDQTFLSKNKCLKQCLPERERPNRRLPDSVALEGEFDVPRILPPSEGAPARTTKKEMRVLRNYKERSKPKARPVATGAVGRVVFTVRKALPCVACGSIVLVLPIGYYPDNPDSTDLMVGAHTGRGEVASVIRGCDGGVHSEASSFSDVSYSAYMAVPPGRRSAIVLGVRGGYWESRAGFARDDSKRSPERQVHFSYVNPNFNIESKYVGMGMGHVLGKVPERFEYLDEPSFTGSGRRTCRLSGHVRLGNVEKGYFAVSVAENTPLVSGGGITDLGVGYRVGRSALLYSGMALGFYDGVGFVHQGRFKLKGALGFDVTLRLGDNSENAVSLGITYRFRVTKRAKP